MSWKATAWIKPLIHKPNGQLLTAREKLLLFVLADYYNDERLCAWASLETIAKDSLTSRRHAIRILRDLELCGLIKIQAREQNSNLYFFPCLTGDTVSPPGDISVEASDTAMSPASDTAMSSKPSLNCHSLTVKKPPAQSAGAPRTEQEQRRIVEARETRLEKEAEARREARVGIGPQPMTKTELAQFYERIKHVGKQIQMPRAKSEVELDEKRRELLLQGERIKRDYPRKAKPIPRGKAL